MSQQGVERAWWWKVAMHLDEAQLATSNVMPHNAEDPTPVYVLQGKLREVQAFLLEIFRWKGLLPGSVPSAPVAPAVAVGGSPSEHMPTGPMALMGVALPQKYASVVPEAAILPQAAILPKDIIITSKIAEDGGVINDVVPCAEAPEPMTAEGPENPSSEGSDVG
jgi:hypothetical protein